MPIPAEDSAWPPPEFAPAYDAYRDWDAWYAGNPDKLHRAYRGRVGGTSQNLPPSQRTYPGQRAGGLVGLVSRWLWGPPPSTMQSDTRLHVPLAADLTSVAAKLMYAEPPELRHDDTAVQARLEQLEEDGFAQLLLQSAEPASAFGDVYLRPVIDEEVVPGKAFLAPVHADGAIPTIRWGHLTEVTFWSIVASDGRKVWRLLEHHDVVAGAGRIAYRLYEGTTDNLGQLRPLDAMQSTASYLKLVDGDGFQATQLDELDVVRVVNDGPQRTWRTDHTLKYLGRSDLDGNEQVFDKIDTVWTSWLTDIRLARGRVHVPAHMLQDLGPGQGAFWDADREVYAALRSMNQDASTDVLTVSQFKIRHEEHRATIEALFETALRHAGLSQQTVGEKGDVAATATEVQARERQSFTTRGARWQRQRPAFGNAVRLLLKVEQRAMGKQVEPAVPDMDLPDGVQDGQETVARTLQLLHAAEAVSVETKVRRVNPDWDDKQVMAEVRKILDEQRGTAAPPELSLGDLAGNRPPGAG